MRSLSDLTSTFSYFVIVNGVLLFDGLTLLVFEFQSGIDVDEMIRPSQLFNHNIALLVIRTTSLTV